MKTDKELLQMAAKAMGFEVYETTDGTLQNRPIWVFSAGGAMGTMPYEVHWNPLMDDTQAFRLAVKLQMTVAYEPNRGGWSVGAIVDGEFKWLSWDEDCARAIVLAAASIGETI